MPEQPLKTKADAEASGRSIRLNKVLAESGLCSRRKADELIRSGSVTVNMVVILELGTRVDPATDEIRVNGALLRRRGEAREAGGKSCLMLHKPVQVVSTASDPQGRRTVLDFLPEHLRGERLYPVGRLDYFSEGLILLTNDGELTNRLTHPRHHLPKIYEVKLRKAPNKEKLRFMRQGMTLREGEKLAPVEVDFVQNAPDTLLMTLRQGVNRQIRRMCRDLDLVILSLRRVQLGPLRLGALPKGECRPLTDAELAALKSAAGLK